MWGWGEDGRMECWNEGKDGGMVEGWNIGMRGMGEWGEVRIVC